MFFASIPVLVALLFCALGAADTEAVLEQLDLVVSLGEDAEISLHESVRDAIEADPVPISAALVERLADESLSEDQLVIYTWALGLAGQPAGADMLMAVHARTQSEQVRGNCLRALANIADDKAGEYLMTVLEKTTDGERRFDILNLLAQMKFEPALPHTEEILGKDPAEFYWQTIFIFGKMGDAAVPFLLSKVGDDDLHVRTNAVAVLGIWLVASEAAAPLQERYWIETDVELRGAILVAMERTVSDAAQMREFFAKVLEKEQDKGLIDFARESFEAIATMQSETEDFIAERSPSAELFQREYDLLMKSAGKEGDYDALGSASTAADEPALKALRERIFQRDSDESFYDYQQINGIIIHNRLAAEIASEKPPQP